MALFPSSKTAPEGTEKKPFSLFKWAATGYIRGGVWGVKKAVAGVGKVGDLAGAKARELAEARIVAAGKRR